VVVDGQRARHETKPKATCSQFVPANAVLSLPGVAASADAVAVACQKGTTCLAKTDFDAAISAYTEASLASLA
jgi:hypothetical protein